MQESLFPIEIEDAAKTKQARQLRLFYCKQKTATVASAQIK